MKAIIENIINLWEKYFTKSNGEVNFLGNLLKIFIIFIVVKAIVIFINKLIDKTLKNQKAIVNQNNRRANTIAAVLKKLISYLMYFIGSVMVLEIFNINTTSILATAGIGGLAIGFGAQSLVKDIITGFFILFEDQYAVGDYIKIGSLEGFVDELGVRVTKLRDASGDMHIIPNGNIQIVTNRTRSNMRALVEIPVSYEEDMDKIMNILDRVCKVVKEDNKVVLDGPTVLGISNLGESSISISIIARTEPMEQWNIERQIRKKVKEEFEKENISVPYPKRIIVGGKDSDF